MRSKWMLVAAFVAGGFASGCGSYYKVTNPSNGDVYYTDNLDRQQSGMVVFKDGKTGQQVTLGASEVQQITKEEYNVGRFAPEPAKNPSQPAPSQASAQAPTTNPAPSQATAQNPTTAPNQ